jgi:hypothetical protein
MGIDFIRSRAHDFSRSWDRHRVDLATRSLFTRDPACLPRSAVATLTSPRTIPLGSVLIVRCDNIGLTVYDELTPVAQFSNPPPDMVSAIRESGGCAKGEVTAIHGSTLLEISIC